MINRNGKSPEHESSTFPCSTFDSDKSTPCTTITVKLRRLYDEYNIPNNNCSWRFFLPTRHRRARLKGKLLRNVVESFP